MGYRPFQNVRPVWSASIFADEKDPTHDRIVIMTLNLNLNEESASCSKCDLTEKCCVPPLGPDVDIDDRPSVRG